MYVFIRILLRQTEYILNANRNTQNSHALMYRFKLKFHITQRNRRV